VNGASEVDKFIFLFRTR